VDELEVGALFGKRVEGGDVPARRTAAVVADAPEVDDEVSRGIFGQPLLEPLPLLAAGRTVWAEARLARTSEPS